MSNERTIIVTGGAGYVGSHASKALAQAGYLPVVYDNLVTGHKAAVKWGPLEEGDVLDRDRLDQVLAKYMPRAVMHFAAAAYVGESVTQPGKYYRNNVAGSLSLLEAMRDAGVYEFVFSSTCATYGIPQQVPIGENTPQRPINAYGASKLMVERIIADFGSAHSTRATVLRYFNAAGADPDCDIGEEHDPETHLIPLAIESALDRNKCITIFGDDYDTPDGTCIRDYIHVSDLADAHVLALDKLLAGNPPDTYNLGNGCGFSVREVIETVERVSGLRVSVSVGARRAGDPPQLVSDAAKARLAFGWTPKRTLDEIVQTAWAWKRHSMNKRF